MEQSRKVHVIMQRIKIVLRAYSLVRFLCHDSKYRSLHSKLHISPFSSHRKDIRSCNSICGAFLDEYINTINTDTAPQSSSFLSFVPPLSPPPPPLLCTPRAVHPHTPICRRCHTTDTTVIKITLHHACSLKSL